MKINVWDSIDEFNAQSTYPLTSGMHDSKYANVPTADIMNICCKLICTDQKELASLVDVTVIKCLHHFDLNKLCCEVIE